MKKNIISINLNLKKRNIISKIEEKDESNLSNSSNFKNNEDIIIETINRKKIIKRNKIIPYDSKEMTTTDQIENTSTPKNLSISYNIICSVNSFRFKHKSPYQYYQNWINLNVVKNNTNKAILKRNSKINNETSENKKKKKCCCSIF